MPRVSIDLKDSQLNKKPKFMFTLVDEQSNVSAITDSIDELTELSKIDNDKAKRYIVLTNNKKNIHLLETKGIKSANLKTLQLMPQNNIRYIDYSENIFGDVFIKVIEKIKFGNILILEYVENTIIEKFFNTNICKGIFVKNITREIDESLYNISKTEEVILQIYNRNTFDFADGNVVMKNMQIFKDKFYTYLFSQFYTNNMFHILSTALKDEDRGSLSKISDYCDNFVYFHFSKNYIWGLMDNEINKEIIKTYCEQLKSFTDKGKPIVVNPTDFEFMYIKKKYIQ